MTLLDSTFTSSTVTHPLSTLTADEIDIARAVLVDAGAVGTSTRFVYMALDEPDKAIVHAFTAGSVIERRVRVLLLHRNRLHRLDHKP